MPGGGARRRRPARVRGKYRRTAVLGGHSGDLHAGARDRRAHAAAPRVVDVRL